MPLSMRNDIPFLKQRVRGDKLSKSPSPGKIIVAAAPPQRSTNAELQNSFQDFLNNNEFIAQPVTFNQKSKTKPPLLTICTPSLGEENMR